MKELYGFTDRAAGLYETLMDDRSKRIFLKRLQYDVAPSVDSALELFALTGILSGEEILEQFTWRREFTRLRKEHKKIVLYGAGVCGRSAGELILHSGGDFDAFCDRAAERYPEGSMGKPVVSLPYLLERREEIYVVITAVRNALEIDSLLRDSGFPADHILPYFNKFDPVFDQMIDSQYFEFPELYPRGTAFVDGGCFDGKNSVQFSKWCGGAYSKIFAFEPDPECFLRCKAVSEQGLVSRMEVFHAGLSDRGGQAAFAVLGGESGYLATEDRDGIAADGLRTVGLVVLDQVVRNERVGFIKLDIEGAEYDALLGARETIRRDRPLLAVCVYHRRGDVLALMELLSEMVPQYRFWLRHYTPFGYETVLYAAVPEIEKEAQK